MTEDAEIMLLILAANGGEMDRDDLRREWSRIMAMRPAEREQWRERIAPLVRANAKGRRK